MDIQLRNFIPSPLAENFSGNSDVWLRDNVDLSTASSTLIISPSGKGKSSLISSIYGLRNDYKGSLFINGQDVKGFGLKKWSLLRENKIAIVFQDLMLFPELSAFENICIKNRLTHHKSIDEIEGLFVKLGMLEFKHQKVATLSFGQQQRVAILRALCQPFETLLLDEPFSHLDPENAKIAWELMLEESNKRNANIIITALSSNDYVNVDYTLNI